MLTEHISSVYSKKFFMGIFDSMLVKYGAVMIGYSILGLPVFGGRKDLYKNAKGGNDASMIAKDYIRNSSLLINLAKVKFENFMILKLFFKGYWKNSSFI